MGVDCLLSKFHHFMLCCSLQLNLCSQRSMRCVVLFRTTIIERECHFRKRKKVFVDCHHEDIYFKYVDDLEKGFEVITLLWFNAHMFDSQSWSICYHPTPIWHRSSARCAPVDLSAFGNCSQTSLADKHELSGLAGCHFTNFQHFLLTSSNCSFQALTDQVSFLTL